MAQLRSVSLFDASGGTWSLSFETVVDPNGTGAVELTAGQGVMIGPLRMARKSPGSHLAARGEQPLGSAGITMAEGTATAEGLVPLMSRVRLQFAQTGLGDGLHARPQEEGREVGRARLRPSEAACSHRTEELTRRC